MLDIKNQFVKRVEESLAGVFSVEDIDKISSAVLTSMVGYDIVKMQTALVAYDGINEYTLKRFCTCMLIEGKSVKTIDQYRRTVKKLFDIVQKNYTEMGVYDIRLFLAFEKQRGISNRTLENTRANISAFFQWMVREDMINKNPCMNISPIKYIDKVRLPFSSVEIDLLRRECKNSKERALIEMLLSSGVRVSELTNIKICDIDFNNMSVHITKGKGSKERMVYINELTREHVKEYLSRRKNNGEYLFYNKKNSPLNPGGVRYILNSISKRAGVNNVHPHRFRRTFATGLSDRGMNVQEIGKLLGHSDISTTLKYVYTSESKIQNLYKKYTM